MQVDVIAPQTPEPGVSAGFSVHVLATTPEGTACALGHARHMGRALGARIVLLVPRLAFISSGFPNSDYTDRLLDEHRALAARAGVDAGVVACVCRRPEDIVHEMLDRSSLLIVGGRRQRLWPGPEQRLATRLTAEGYSVVFAQVGSRQRMEGGMKALVTAWVLATAVTASAQTPPEASDAQERDPLADIQFGVAFEGFYQSNWNKPYDRVNLLRAYDTRANVFGIQQAAFVIESAPKVDEGRRFGARVDLQFGQATETVQGGAANEPRPDVYRHVWQAYGTYVFPVGRGLTTDFGKFASMLGYETNYAKDNNQFSRAYLFNFLPFYHSGLRASLPVGDKVTLMYMLTNGVQQAEDFNNFKSNHLAAIVKPTGALTWTVNYYFGQEQADGALPIGPDGFFRVFDTYVAYTATPTLSFGLDVNYVTNEVNKSDPETALQGVGAYTRYQVSDPAALSLRYERLDDEGLFGGIDQVLQEITLTAEYKFADGFLVRGEFRRDWSNEAFFTTADPDERRDHQNTFLIGMVWWFGNKTGGW